MKQLDSYCARDFMTRELVTFTQDQEIMTAIRTLIQRRISGGPVLDGKGNLIGVLSEKDCLKIALAAGYEGVPAGLVKEVMSSKVVTVNADDNLLHVASKFVDSPFKRLPVVEEGRLVGQISRSDVLRAIDQLY